jgi:hypothetical protein
MTPWREDLYSELGDRAIAWLWAEGLRLSMAHVWLALKTR